MTFQTWVAELIEKRFGTATALAAKIGMELSPFSRGVTVGTLNLVNLLKLAKVADEDPSKVLRLAGKEREADLIEELYGAHARSDQLTASERELLDAWRQLTLAARTSWLTFVRETHPRREQAADDSGRRRREKGGRGRLT